MKSSVMKVAFSFFAMAVLVLAIPFHLGAQDTPAGAWAGTWKFNLEKSKFPGNRLRRTRLQSIRMAPSPYRKQAQQASRALGFTSLSKARPFRWKGAVRTQRLL